MLRHRLTARVLIALTLSFALSCAGSHEAAPDVDYFVPDHVLEVEIEVSESNWDALRFQTRALFDILGGADCLADPFGSPFTYVDATVTVDGERREHVGLRKKGFLGSLSTDRPSLKIKFDEFVVGQDLFGTERMTLNNAQQDPSYVDQCLSYDLFAHAGVPAPRCNFAHVTVNGRDMGVYVHVENVKKRFLRRHFADDEGHLYEGTVSDFRDGWDGTFEQKTNRDVPSDRADIAAVATAAQPGATPASLGAVIELDGFLDLWTVETLIGHWDGYTGDANNYYVYQDPTDSLMHFIPWGVDATFGQSLGDGPGGAQPDMPAFTTGVIAARLWESDEGRALYQARMRDVLARDWDEARLESELDRMAALIRPYLLPRDTERGFDDAIEQRRDFIRGRRAQLEAALATPFTSPPLREPFCFAPVGDLDAGFDTVYGTLDSMNPFAHPGTLTATLDGTPGVFTNVGSIGGTDGGDPNLATVAVLAVRSDGIVNIVAAQTPKENVAPGAHLALDFAHATGFILEVDPRVPGAEPRVVATLGNGFLDFEQGATADGSPLVGRLYGEIFPPLF